MMIFRKLYWSDLRYFGSGRDFVWSIPVVHVVLLLIPGVLLAAISRIRTRLVSLAVGSWLLATLAIWAALLRAPLYGASTLLLAAGVARLLSGLMAASIVRHQRQWKRGLVGLLAMLVVMASCSSGWHALGEHRVLANLPAPPPGALNVVLIVWDTVRASSLSLHDYPRDTTPNLVRWAKKGVRFSWPWRRPPGRTPRIAASSPASGLTSSILSGTSTLTHLFPRLRSSWPRGVTRPPGSPRTLTVPVARPGWIGVLRITTITL